MSDTSTTNLGSVLSLWRYPVKSMLGEEIQGAVVTARGLVGDRAYAVLDQSSGKVASAKHPRKWGRLLACHAVYREGPYTEGHVASVHITLPDGTVVSSQQRTCNALLSNALNCKVTLATTRPEKPSVESVDAFATTETPRDIGRFMLHHSAFADYAPVHLLTTAMLDQLRTLYPQGRFEVQRFRPNLVVETGAGQEGFVENAWVGRMLAIGDEVRLRISDPTPRCIMTTLPQGDVPHDLEILRTVVQHNQVDVPALGGKAHACVGVYAFVLTGGTIRCGDSVRLA